MIFSLITNNPVEAKAADEAGIQRIMIDLEKKGKARRQKGKDLFLSTHQPKDISLIQSNVQRAAIVVRINPIHSQSGKEVERVIDLGADYVMMPYFFSIEEVRAFHHLVKGRAKTILLLETDGAMNIIEEIISISPPSEFHIGLNDLSICLNKKNIFGLFQDGTIETITARLRPYNIPYGISGVGSLSQAELPISPTDFLIEQIRLGATRGWLGRSFRKGMNPNNMASEFQLLTSTYERWQSAHEKQFESSHESFLAQISKYATTLFRDPPLEIASDFVNAAAPSSKSSCI